jgi:hypothetical protein
MSELQQFVEFSREVVAKFATLVCHNFKRNQVSADPPVEDGLADGGGLLVGQGDKLDVLCEGISDCEDVTFTSSKVTKRPEQICKYFLIRLGWLRQRREECRSRTVIVSADLTFVTGFEMISDHGIHAWPAITLENPFFCFVDSVMSCEEVTVCILENVIDESLWKENDDTAWFKLLLYSTPDNVVIHKAVTWQGHLAIIDSINSFLKL